MSNPLNGYQLAAITAASFAFLTVLRQRSDSFDLKLVTEFKWFHALCDELGLPAEDLRTQINARVRREYSFLWVSDGTTTTFAVLEGLDAEQIRDVAQINIQALKLT